MKKVLGGLLILLSITCGNLYAADVTTVKAKDTNISDNLDLEAVASVFGESKDLEEFEKKLNDPDTQISNLDLNEDGEVDYLRVMETAKEDTHLVTIQAVLGKNQYQDVATIDVEKKGKDKTQVQVVGDVYMYGPGYIVEPVYAHPPVIFLFFWGSVYRPWHSPFYWGYYPPYYRPWRPYPRHRYQANVRVNININNSYRYTSVRKSKTSIDLHKKSRRNDFGVKNPDKSFRKRNEGMNNRQGLNKKRDQPGLKTSTGKKVQKDWKPHSKSAGAKSKATKARASDPAQRAQVPPLKSDPKRQVKSNSARSKQQMGRPSPNRSANRPKGWPRR